jgi:tetratricopeptide (TPR) repeat protein
MFKNKYRQAENFFVEALKQIKASQTVQDNDYFSFSFDYDDEGENNKTSDIIFRPLQVATYHQDQSSFHLCNRAFLIVLADKDKELRTNVHDEARISAVIMYNLGLCFQARQRTQDQCSALDKAVKLYSAAVTLLEFSSSDDRLLQLALLNNQGYILACTNNYNALQQCLKALSEIFAMSARLGEFRREDIVEIQMNVVLLFGNHTHASAA